MSHETIQVIQPSNPLEVLNLIDAKSCDRFAHDMAALVQQGHVDPIQVRVLISAWEKAFKSLKTAIEPEVAREAEKHGKSFEFMGAKCEWVPTYTEYDYSRDVTWENLKQAVEKATEKRKEREAFLKTVKEPFKQVDEETGEVMQIYPPVKKQTEGLKITIK
jgi:hypothetical protein